MCRVITNTSRSFYKSSVTFFSSQWRTDFTYTSIFRCWVVKIWKENFVFFCGLMSLGFVVILGDCLISEGETDDDGIIAIADVEVGWSQNWWNHTYNDVRVSWFDRYQCQCWLSKCWCWSQLNSIFSSLFRASSIQVFEDVLVLSMVDCRHFRNKVVIFFYFNGFVYRFFI